jgi:hypothetical protein
MSEDKIPANIISKFEKQLFKPGDAVCFTWFNVKRYGYVTSYKQVNWGIQYTVKLDKMSYPCGMQIDEWKTKYRTGLIQYTETKRLGSDQVAELATTTRPMYETVSFVPTTNTELRSAEEISTDSKNVKQTRIAKRKSKQDVGVLGEHDTIDNSEISKRTKRRNIDENANESSIDGMSANVAKSRTRSKKVVSDTLEQAIQKQRDFLSGFIKKD